MSPKKIVVGMSGGVDSSISVMLLKKQGWSPVGVSLKLAHWKNKCNLLKENVCCSKESFDIAKKVCKKLDTPYYIYDVSKDFEKTVMDYFVSELKKTKTPNPCVICNRYLKFSKLFEFAKKHKIEYVATGHYAITKFNKKTKKYELLRPKDTKKDQTYGLCWLPQEWIKNIILPLGNYTKDEVYKLAEKNGFDIFLKRKQSQDLCFVSGKAIPLYIKQKIGENPGIIKDENNKVLGKHKGLYYYTIGQKKGLNLNDRYYVKDFDIKNNVLIVTKNKESINKKEIIVYPFSFTGNIPKKENILAKVRYGQPLSKAILRYEKGKLKIKFKKPQYAVTPGQFCVFYKGKVCLGGGIIN